MSGSNRQHSPFVSTPVAANTEVFMDRIGGIAFVTAAFSCDTDNKEGGTVADIYLSSAAE